MPFTPRRIAVYRITIFLGTALALTTVTPRHLDMHLTHPHSGPTSHISTATMTRAALAGDQGAHESNQKIDWNIYRIGDGIARYPGAPGCEQFPQSIVCEYEHFTNAPNDVDVLIRVLESRRWHSYQIDVRSTAFIHVRVGDGLCAENDDDMCRKGRNGVPDCWNHDSDCWYDAGTSTKQYAYSKEWYSNVLQELDLLTDISGVVILGDVRHWTRSLDPRQDDYRVDEAYLESVASFFRSQHRTAMVMSTGTPDQDFALLCLSQVFVQGGGGYSALIREVVRYRGGLVLSPKPP